MYPSRRLILYRYLNYTHKPKKKASIESARNKSARPYDYHNGADWPYWSAMYAYALKLKGREFEYPLTKWFDFNVEKGNFTPIEYYSPYCKDGSLLQAWSPVTAFVYNDANCDFFKIRYNYAQGKKILFPSSK